MKELKISCWLISLVFGLTIFLKGAFMWWNIAFLSLPQLPPLGFGWGYVFNMIYSMLCGGYLLVTSIRCMKNNWNFDDE